MDEKMTWNPTYPKMDKVSWSPLKSGETTSGPLYTSDQGPGQIILLVTALGQEP
jgi:hypothetical protein